MPKSPARTLADVATLFGVTLPEAMTDLYARADGEKPGSHRWRLLRLEEYFGVDYEEAYFEAYPEAMLLKRFGALVPLFTNDGSDLLVLHVGGPLDGRLSLVLHDDTHVPLAFRSIASLLKKRKANAFRDGDLESFDYRRTEPKRAKGDMQEADDRAAEALEQAFAKLDDAGEGDADLVAATARLLRCEVEPEDTSAFPTIWPEKHFVDRVLFTGDLAFGELIQSSSLICWSRTGEATKVTTPLRGKDTAYVCLGPDGDALFMVAKQELWRIATNGKFVRKKLFAVGPRSERVWGVVDGCFLVANRDSEIEVWTPAGELRATIPTSLDGVDDVLVSHDGKTIFAVPWTGDALARVDLAARTATKVDTATAPIECAGSSPDGTLVAIADEAGAITVVDARSGKTLRSIAAAHDDRPTGIVINDAGVVVSVSELDDSIRSFDAKGTPVERIDLKRPARVSLGLDGRAYVSFAYRGVGRYDIDDAARLEPVRD